MNKIDYLGLDGNTLRTFLTVLEEMSVSKAAERLGLLQDLDVVHLPFKSDTLDLFWFGIAVKATTRRISGYGRK